MGVHLISCQKIQIHPTRWIYLTVFDTRNEKPISTERTTRNGSELHLFSDMQVSPRATVISTGVAEAKHLIQRDWHSLVFTLLSSTGQLQFKHITFISKMDVEKLAFKRVIQSFNQR